MISLLVHEYEDLDHQLLCRSIPQIIEDVTGFVEEVSNQL